MKEPKRYECLVCGFKSVRSKTLKIGGIGFAVCYKCRGQVKETDEWKEWLKKVEKEGVVHAQTF